MKNERRELYEKSFIFLKRMIQHPRYYMYIILVSRKLVKNSFRTLESDIFVFVFDFVDLLVNMGKMRKFSMEYLTFTFRLKFFI